jgi:streptogramin lyase
MLLGGAATAWAQGQKTWTDTPDWASAASFDSVTWTEVQGQIQLIKNPPRNFNTPYIYIPNSVSNTVTQLSTKTGQKNWTISLDSVFPNGDPSRTTVDVNQDVWVGLRNTDKVVWISAQGQIKKVVTTGQRPRGITIDLQNNVWVGNWDANTLTKLDGRTGDVLLNIPMACPYGAATDVFGNIWIVNRCQNIVTKVRASDGQTLATSPAQQGYGIATDRLGQVWVAHYQNGCVFRILNDGQNMGCIPLGSGCRNARGVAVDGDGNAWVACSNTPLVVKVNSAGQVVGNNTQVGQGCVGMAVDADGFVWAVAQGDATASKINAKTNQLAGKYPTDGQGPYTYSDMTGFQFQSIARAATGFWTGIHGTQCPSRWKTISWQEILPPGTSVEVTARTAPTQAALATAQWSAPLQNGAKPSVVDHPWIEVRATLRTFDAQVTPAVTEITVTYEGAGVEVCNGIDDDCDGLIDNIPGTNQPITKKCVTACGEGIAACVAGDWDGCSARSPSIEICDGIDNDCDGKIDEGDGNCGSNSVCIGGACLRSCTGECPRGQICKDDGSGQKRCFGVLPCEQLTCAAGEICRQGICQEPCANVSCPSGSICDNGQCVADDCYSPHKACGNGQVCRQGQCEVNACATTSCAPGEFCRNGQCLPSCAGVTCPPDQSCRDGQCQADPCFRIRCGVDEICKAGQCTADPCAQIACRGSLTCINGDCVDDPCATVSCATNEVCRRPQGDCVARSGSTIPNNGENNNGNDGGTGNDGNGTGNDGNGTGNDGNGTGNDGNGTGNDGDTNDGKTIGEGNTIPGGGNRGGNGGGCLCDANEGTNFFSFLFLALIVVFGIGYQRSTAPKA